MAEPEVAFGYAPLFNKHQATPAKVGFCEPMDYSAFLLEAKQQTVARCAGFMLALQGVPGTYPSNGDTYNVQCLILNRPDISSVG